MSTPLLNTFCGAIDRHKSRSCAIHHVGTTCNPAAILWLVVAVVIHTVDFSTLKRRLSHIGNEVIKCMPSFTDLYASASVTGVRLALDIMASPQHAPPDAVDACPAPSMCSPELLCNFDFEAPTTLAFTAIELGCDDNSLVATLTSTSPSCSTASIVTNAVKNSPASELFSGNVKHVYS